MGKEAVFEELSAREVICPSSHGYDVKGRVEVITGRGQAQWWVYVQDAVAAAKSTLMLSKGFQNKGMLRLFGRRRPSKN